MHELSLANEICRIIEQQVARDRGAAAVRDVTIVAVEVGLEANVEPNNLQFCLDALLTTPPFGSGTAILERVAGDDLRVAWFEIEENGLPGAPPPGEACDVPQEITA